MDFWKKKQRELDEEIAFHLREEARLRTDRGESAENARQGTLRDFGNVASVAEATRETWGWGSVERLRDDVRFSLRLMRRSPSFYLAAVGALALGIGANTAIFSAADSVLLKPLPFDKPEEIVSIWEDRSDLRLPTNTPSPPEWQDLRSYTDLFADVAATRGTTYNITGEGPPDLVMGRRVTANFWTVLGIQPALGRFFVGEEDRRGSRVAVISHGFWQRRFGGDAGALGKQIMLNGQPYVVIGVLPREFSFLPTRLTDVWTPMSFAPTELNNRGLHALHCIARLRAGVGIEQARNAIPPVGPDGHRFRFRVIPIREGLTGNTRLVLLVLLSGAACLLLIACANLANLLLARGSTRQRELALRAALGASQMRLVRQLLTESVVLSLAGGVAGVAIAWTALPLLESLAPETMIVSLSLDGRVLLFTAAVSLAAATLFGTVHAVLAGRTPLAASMRDGVRGTTGGRSRRVHDVLIVVETAVAVLLLVAAGVVVQTLIRLQHVDLGLNASHLLTLAAPVTGYTDHARRDAYLDAVTESISAVRGVRAAAWTSSLPVTDPGNATSYMLEGQSVAEQRSQDALIRVVSRDYFRTIDARVVGGRLFTPDDRSQTQPVIVVNDTFAQRHFRGRSVVGLRVRLGRMDPADPAYVICGIVADIRERGVQADLKPAVYLVNAQALRVPQVPNALLIRTDNEPYTVFPAIRQAIWSVNPDQAVARVRTMEEIVAAELTVPRRSSVFLSAFSGLALLLASLGIYGVLNYTVAQRTAEIGVRMALGASRGSIALLVARRGIVLTAIGLTIGLILSLLAVRLMSRMLFDAPGVDWVTPLVSAVVLLLVATLAAALPARRAASLDPAVTLRSE